MLTSKTSKILRDLLLIIFLIIIYIPIFFLIVNSFNVSRTANQYMFSTFGYKALFRSRDIVRALFTTILVAVISTIISVTIGLFASISLGRETNKFKKWILTLNNIPIMNPDIITAISMLVIFGTFKIPYGYLTLILSHTAFCVSYVIVTIYPKVISLDKDLYDAANDLGATNTQTIFKVVIPQLKESILSATLIAFTLSFDDFVISYFAAGSSGIVNISVYIYTLKNINKYLPRINALSTLIILVIFLKVGYDYFISFKKKNLKGVR